MLQHVSVHIWIIIRPDDGSNGLQWPTFPHSHPEDSCICHNVLSANVCLQHRILGFANGTTVTQLPGLPQHFGISDQQDASSEGLKDWSQLMRIQSCTTDVEPLPSNCCSKAAVCRTVWGLGTKRWESLPSISWPGHLTAREIIYTRTCVYRFIPIYATKIWYC
jgi:hypothetical protein